MQKPDVVVAEKMTLGFMCPWLRETWNNKKKTKERTSRRPNGKRRSFVIRYMLSCEVA